MVRPHNDVYLGRPELDAIETLHHVRESAARWQETAERIARQRDEAITLAHRYCEALEQIASMGYHDARDGYANETARTALDGSD